MTTRRMTPALEDAIERTVGPEREVLIRSLSRSSSPYLAALHRALAVELEASRDRQARAFARIKAGLPAEGSTDDAEVSA